jgi:hypothetical protein
MGRACNTTRGDEGMHIGYWWESQKVDNIKMDFRNMEWGDMS